MLANVNRPTSRAIPRGGGSSVNVAKPPSRVAILLVAAGLAVAALVAYANSISVPFVLDDDQSIADNATIRHLGTAWFPPRGGGLTVEGRPVLNFTLAVDYAVHGVDRHGYHVANLAIHLGAGLLLFGLLRRTLRLPRFAGSSLGSASLPVAACTAALWLLHPLQTEAVTYVIQRAESLCGFFYFLTLYAFVRGIEWQLSPEESPTQARARWRWWGLAIAACALGMGTKEVMVSAPLIVLLYDRTFVARGFGAAWRRRRGIHAALLSTWLLLAVLVGAFHGRSGSAGFNATVSPWHYALTQCHAVVLYLKLCIWPQPLVFDYGTTLVTSLGDVAPEALGVVALVFMTAFALWRWPAVGFLGTWFLATLAPSSSVVPVVTQTIAEHRMYLALAALVTALVAAAYGRIGRGAIVLCAGAAIGGALLTHSRNATYRSHLALWGDTVAKRPDNTRARNDLGLVLRDAHRFDEALAQFDAALRIDPGALAIRNNRANVLADLRRFPEALADIDAVLQAAPGLAEAYDTKADILSRMGRSAEAKENYARAVQLKPELAHAPK